MRPWSPEYHGSIEERSIESAALIGNALGDSATRPLWVYLPPGYNDDPDRRYPAVYFLQGYAAALPRWGNRPAFGRTVPELIDEVFADRSVPGCLVVFVDAWTSLGGSQFVDSVATGNYHTYLCEDVVPFIDRHYRTIADGPHRALQGHSSGGFGAMVNAMLRPDLFGAIASHAGDSAYELCYLSEIAAAYRSLRDEYDRSYDKFFEDFSERQSLSRRSDFTLLMVYALAACFSPNPDGSVALPFDPQTGNLVDEIWQRWLAWDPVRMVSKYSIALQQVRTIWIDAGRDDEYSFDIGAERIVQELQKVGITDVAFELFSGRHGNIDHRYPLAMRYLAQQMGSPLI